MAALSCRTGEVIWRQQALPNTEFVSLQVKDQAIVTLGDDGRITAWSAQNGSAFWMSSETGSSEAVGDVLALDHDYVLVSSTERLCAFSLANGEKVWCRSQEKGTADVLGLTSDSQKVFAVNRHTSKNNVALKEFDRTTGDFMGESALKIDHSISQKDIVLSEDSDCPVLLHRKSSTEVDVRILSTGAATVLKTSKAFASFTAHSKCHESSLNVVLHLIDKDANEWAEVFLVEVTSPGSTTAASYQIPAVSLPSAYTIAESALRHYIVRVTADAGTGSIEIWSFQNHGRLAHHTIRLDGTHIDQFRHISAEVAKGEEDGELKVRVMLTTNGCDFQMWRGVFVDWSRPEGLTKVEKVILVALPERQSLEVIQALTGNIATDFFDRLRRHIEQLMNFLSGRRLVKQNEDHLPVRDHFGLRQYAVSFSADRIWAIDTMASRKIAWTRSLKEADLTFIDAWLTPQADKNFSPYESITLLARKTGSVYEMQLDPLTGSLESSTVAADKPVMLRQSQGHKRTSELTIDSTSVQSTLTNESRRADWSFRVPAGNRIVTSAVAEYNEKVASVGRVLGDRGVMYKYLGKFLAVITVNDLESSLTAFLLSVNDGRIIYHAHHPEVGTNRKINAVISENWFVYHFWSGGETNAYQMVVTELYQGERNTRLSHTSSDVHALSQAFIYDHEITAMSVTTSRQGITSRDLIVALHSNQILTIPRRLLDPRRPVADKLTAADKEELLIPYEPLIPLDSRTTLSHSAEVIGINHIVAGPTLLESTGLICAYGLDFFITRVTPSMPFDILSDSFSKAQIILSLTLLLMAVLVTRPMAAKKVLTRRWIG